MSETQKKRRSGAVGMGILSCLLLAGALRIWGMNYGVPHPTVRPDEERVVGRAHDILATLDLNPVAYTYPGLMIYLNALVLAVYAWIGQLLGYYDGLFDFLFAVAVTRPGLHYLICRALTVALGVGTVGATFLLAREGYGSQTVGLVAAFCLATNYLHVRDSHFATVDVGTTFFVTMSLLYAVKASSRHRWRDYLLAGFFAGAAAAAKYNAGLVILGAGAACISGLVQGRKQNIVMGKSSPLPRFLVAVAVMGIGFALLSPYSLVHFEAAVRELAGVRRILNQGEERGLWVHLGVTFPAGFGWPLYLAAMVGIVRSAWLRRPTDLVLLAFVIPFFLLVADVRMVFPRYVLPLVPILSVLAAELVVSFLPSGRRVAVAVATIVLIGPGFRKSAQFDRLLARQDTRLLASEWVSENLPRRTAVLICPGYGAPVINADRRRPPAFQPQEIPCSLRAVLGAEADYLITHEHPVLRSSPPLPEDLAEFLEERAEVLARFDPFPSDFLGNAYYYRADGFYLPFSGLDSVERGGPKITIWKLARDEGGPDEAG